MELIAEEAVQLYCSFYIEFELRLGYGGALFCLLWSSSPTWRRRRKGSSVLRINCTRLTFDVFKVCFRLIGYQNFPSYFAFSKRKLYSFAFLFLYLFKTNCYFFISLVVLFFCFSFLFYVYFLFSLSLFLYKKKFKWT